MEPMEKFGVEVLVVPLDCRKFEEAWAREGEP